MTLSRNISALLAFLLLSAGLYAAEPMKDKVSFAYDVDFEMNFDNREFYRSAFSSSMTIFGARLTPSIGVFVAQKNGFNHKVMAGIDVMKDFGASPISQLAAGGKTDETVSSLNNLGLFREFTLWYNMQKKAGQTDVGLYAGIFPRRMMQGEYSRAFFSDSLRYYDNNLEGLLLTFGRPKAYFEVGCDWMGQFGTDRRERFMIFSAGKGDVLPFMSIGYSAYMYHFASSENIHGVVDNILANPWVRFDIAHLAGMQRMSARIGWLQGVQNDRRKVGNYIFSFGGELELEVRNWYVGIVNSLFYGTDMMPYYNSVDAGDVKYGSRLYMGDPFYRIHDDGRKGPGTYDRLEVYYEPVVGKFLNIRVAALFHFHSLRYSGCQQTVSLRFNLDGLLNKKH